MRKSCLAFIYPFENVTFDTKREAENVLDQLFDMVIEYGEVSLGVFYNLAGVEADYVDRCFGWTNLREAYVSSFLSEHIIVFPALQKIHSKKEQTNKHDDAFAALVNSFNAKTYLNSKYGEQLFQEAGRPTLSRFLYTIQEDDELHTRNNKSIFKGLLQTCDSGIIPVPSASLKISHHCFICGYDYQLEREYHYIVEDNTEPKRYYNTFDCPRCGCQNRVQEIYTTMEE